MTYSLKIDVGDVFGRLVVQKKIKKDGLRAWYYECTCICGQYKTFKGSHLKSGGTQSCGCLMRERVKLANTRNGRTYSNGKRTRAYNSYHSMIARCYNPRKDGYCYYGGRGIIVCDRWLEGFDNFLSDMGDAPVGHSIDRIDVNGNYEPANCRWATAKEQANNKRKKETNNQS